MQAVTGQPIQKQFFFRVPRVSPSGDHPLAKEPEDSGELEKHGRASGLKSFFNPCFNPMTERIPGYLQCIYRLAITGIKT